MLLCYIALSVWSIANLVEELDRSSPGSSGTSAGVNSDSTEFRVRLAGRQALSGRPAIASRARCPAGHRLVVPLPAGKLKSFYPNGPWYLLQAISQQRPRFARFSQTRVGKDGRP